MTIRHGPGNDWRNKRRYGRGGQRVRDHPFEAVRFKYVTEWHEPKGDGLSEDKEKCAE